MGYIIKKLKDGCFDIPGDEEEMEERGSLFDTPDRKWFDLTTPAILARRGDSASMRKPDEILSVAPV